ncbi:MAG: TIM-barrel domain-containing protein, partial [Polyangia bacterium]
LAFHLFYGPSPLEVIRRHSDLEGRAPVPPDFAFAPWNDAILGSQSVRQVASVLRQNHIPSSVIWTEDWAGGVHTGDNYNLTYQWSVDRTLYPDVEKLAAELHQAGFKFLAYFNTFLESDAAHYPAAIANHYEIEQADGTPYLFDSARFKKTSLVDLTNPAAADWMAGFLNAAIDLGFDGWMADYAEWLPVDAKLFSGEDAEAVHQRYPVLWQKLNERVLGARKDKVDRLVFVRSGYSGSQPIAHQVVWGGDQNTEFSADDGLPTVIPIGLGLGIAGMPYFGSDIAGYQTPPGHPDSTKELFFRWTELGALSPVMRTHHGVAPALEWSFQRDAETLAHYGRWARIHLKLYPYLHAAAAEAAQDGAPLMRALALGFPGDDRAWSATDEYLLGPSLLVAPVTT